MPPPRPPAPSPDPSAEPTPPGGEAEGHDDELDEVGFAIGPDEGGGGLFDRSGSDATGTGEATASTSRPDLASTAQRTALLAWLAADLPSVEAPEESTEPGVRLPPELAPVSAEVQAKLVADLRRALADEPLDPLPALDGIGGGVWPEVARPGARGEAATVLPDDPGALPDESSTTGLLPALPLPALPLPAPAAVPPQPAAPVAAPPHPASPPAPRAAALGGLDALVGVVLLALALAYLFAGR